MSSVVVVFATVAAMEWVAWVSHKYLMHGPAWGWHASHHEPSSTLLEKNDLFAVFFAALAIALIWHGTAAHARGASDWNLQWVGAGMTAYGLLYFIAHDGLVHKRWPLRWVPRHGYLKRLYQSHRLHHVAQSKDDARFFGFLWAQSEAKLRSEVARIRAHRIERTQCAGPSPAPDPAQRA